MYAVAVAMLPAVSAAENRMAFWLTGIIVGALLLTVTLPSTLSTAVAAFRNAVMAVLVFWIPFALVATTVIFCGSVMTGGV